MELALNVGRYGATQMPQYSNLLTTATNIQSAQQTQQMNALKMQRDMEAQQQTQAQNRLLAGAFKDGRYDPQVAAQALAGAGYGAPAVEALEKGAAIQRADDVSAQARLDALTRGRDLIRSFLGGTRGQAQWSAGLEKLKTALNPEAFNAIPKEYSEENVAMVNSYDPKEREIAQYLQGANEQTIGVSKTGRPVAEFRGYTPAARSGSVSDMQSMYAGWLAENPGGTREEFARFYADLTRGTAPTTAAERGKERDLRQQIADARLGFENRRLDLQTQYNNARTENDRARIAQAYRNAERQEREFQYRQEANTPEFKAQQAAALEAGKRTAASDVAAVEDLPKSIVTAQETLQNLADLVGDAEYRGGKLVVPPGGRAPHPGFAQSVGVGIPGLRFIPGTNEADFSARLDQILGRSFLQAFDTLRGGGHITEIEGVKGTQAINRMRLATSEAEFLAAAAELRGIVAKGAERAQQRLTTANQRLKGITAGQGVNAPAAVDQERSAAEEWLKTADPNDPLTIRVRRALQGR
jgi:hypothetical protein